MDSTYMGTANIVLIGIWSDHMPYKKQLSGEELVGLTVQEDSVSWGREGTIHGRSMR